MTDYNVMPDYQTRRKIINDICEKYSFVHHSFAGKSVCGRCIDVLHIGNTKNCVLYCAGFHGSEYLTVTAVLKFLNNAPMQWKTIPLSVAIKYEIFSVKKDLRLCLA